MRFFLFGISALSFAAGCGKETIEYGMTMSLKYINETDSVVSFNLRPDISFNDLENLVIPPKSESKIFTYDVEGVDKKLNPDTCCQGIMNDLFEVDFLNLITLNDTSCVGHQNQKSVILTNYAVEIISDRHFRYTYTFTKGDFENAEPCD